MINEYSKIIEQIKIREIELEDRRQQLHDLVLDITDEEREKIAKKSKKDFFFFAKKVFPEYITKPYSSLHKDIVRFAGTQKRKVHIIAAPPEHGKTALLRLWKIWAAIYGYKHYIIKITETMELSTIDLESIKLEFEENPRLRFLYGDLKTDGRWEKDTLKVAPSKYNKYGCWFEAFAYGVPPTGRLREQYRPDFCDIDDLENYRKSGNISISKDKLQFINNDVLPRVSNDAAIIWFGNNARKTMAINLIIEMDEEERRRDYPSFEINIYPAWNVKTKEPLWKEVYSFDNEEQMRLFFGVGLMTWLGNYQQSPVVPDGNEFKKIHWRVYNSLPKDAIGIIMCDPAGGKSGAFKAGVVILFSIEASKFFVPNLFVRQCDWEEYFLWMYAAYNQYQKHVRFIAWEEDFHQDQFILFRKLYPSVKDKPPLPIIPIPVKGHGPKDERIRSLAVPYEMGQLYFHKDLLLNKEGMEAQMQLVGFPDYAYKDFPDALASGYRIVFNMFAGAMRPPSDDDAPMYESVQKTRVNREVFR